MRSVFPVLLALISITPALAATSHADFSGTWKMDATRSESAHQDVPIGPTTLVIQMTDAGLSVETIRSEGGKPEPVHETLNYKLDGSETTTTSEGGVAVTAKAHWDAAKLVLETTRNVQDSTVSTMYAYTLSPNGREMTVDMTLSVQHGYQGLNAKNTGHGKDVFIRAAK